MLWNNSDIEVEIINIEDQAIHVVLRPLRQDPWMISGVYAKPNKQDKIRIFNSLEALSHQSTLPWLVTGDFNEVEFSYGK